MDISLPFKNVEYIFFPSTDAVFINTNHRQVKSDVLIYSKQWLA